MSDPFLFLLLLFFDTFSQVAFTGGVKVVKAAHKEIQYRCFTRFGKDATPTSILVYRPR